MIPLTVDKEVFQKFNPKLKVIFLAVSGFDNKRKLAESKHLLTDTMQMIRLTHNKEQLKNHYLIQPWALAQAEFGEKAKHYHTSVERLMKTVLQGKTVFANNTLTNLVYHLSLKYVVPFGLDDADKVVGKITFKVASGHEKVDALRKLLPNTLYYRDEKKILGTKLDFWKNSKTALTPNSTSTLIHLDVLPPLTNKQAEEIIKELKVLIKTFCGGKISTFILSKSK